MLSRLLTPIIRAPIIRAPIIRIPILRIPIIRILTQIRYEHYYTRNHEFIDFIDKTNVRIGVSDYAREQLGGIVYVEVSELDTEFEKGTEIVVLESVKTAGSVNAPADGIITETNTELIEDSEKISGKHELDTWLIEFKLLKDIDKNELLSKEDYDKFTKKEIINQCL